MLLRNLDHRFHSLLCHYHSIETEEGVLESLWNILLALVLRLLHEFGLEVSLAKLGALESTVAVEYSKQTNILIKIWVCDMCVLL